MIPGKRKRSLKLSKLKTVYNKRQRVKTFQNTEAAVSRREVVPDALPWSQVETTLSSKETEGFCGLEEVEGIDIVREGKTLKFVVSSGLGENSNELEVSNKDEHMYNNLNLETQTAKAEESYQERTSKRNTREKDYKKLKTNNNNEILCDDLKDSSFNILSEIDQIEKDISAWMGLDLSSHMLTAISKLGFSRPTPIQYAVIPDILSGYDVVGKASTGSGKTLAFVIPIVETWLEAIRDLEKDMNKKQTSAIALMLSPTRELAHQLAEHISALCKGLANAPRVATVTGGLSVQKQQRKLSDADIIIGTPGRLWEVMNSYEKITQGLRYIRFLVIDEADRLLSNDHFEEVDEILSAIDSQQNSLEDEKYDLTRQTLVFSATFQKDLQQKLRERRGKRGTGRIDDPMNYLFEKLKLKKKKFKFHDLNSITIMAENLREGIVECTGTEKDLYLYALLLQYPNKRTLVFTNSIHSVRRITPMLQNLELNAYALYSQMAQKARMRSIERFSSSICKNSILIATDLAARGIDIKDVQLVIHYHLPRTADTYIHRSGRTARAGARGRSILLCSPEEVEGTQRLVAKVHTQNMSFPRRVQPKYYMKSLDVDRKIVGRLKLRVMLAKQIADSIIAKQKNGHNTEWLRTAAEELGVDYDSDEFEANNHRKKGRGNGRRLRQDEAATLTPNNMNTLKQKLKGLLAQKVNVGISEKYLAATGQVNVNELLTGTERVFIGTTNGIFTNEF